MNKYRITKSGKLTIIVFSIIFLVVNISFIPLIRVKTWEYVKAVEKGVNVNNISNNNIIKPDHNNLVKENELGININDVKKSPVINTPVHDTPQVESNEIKEELSYPVELAYKEDGKKVAFLTFDDGPSRIGTPKILDILKYYNIKATFFIIGYEAEKNPDILVRINNDKHSIGNHTYTHNYGKIYSSVDEFIKEIKKTEESFKQVLGNEFYTRICRFPGGSFGESKKPYIEALNRLGYIDINWNTITGDAEGINVETGKLFSRLKITEKHRDHLVILMHDSPSKNTTVEALPEIIEYLKEQGYEFATLK